ncbi:unnamed protein product [Calypogeia fissa]
MKSTESKCEDHGERFGQGWARNLYVTFFATRKEGLVWPGFEGLDSEGFTRIIATSRWNSKKRRKKSTVPETKKKKKRGRLSEDGKSTSTPLEFGGSTARERRRSLATLERVSESRKTERFTPFFFLVRPLRSSLVLH